MTDETWTGGCQCGAVRYRLLTRPNNPCICHCRMCQKQFGSFFGAFAGVSAEHFVLTRGTIAYFQSSSEAERGFCRDCGTPLVYRFLSQPRIDVSIGSLDRHSEMKPEFQFPRIPRTLARGDRLPAGNRHRRWRQWRRRHAGTLRQDPEQQPPASRSRYMRHG